MRAPFQILAIPYRFKDDRVEYCVLHRSDCDMWQFIAGGGEDSEAPIDAAGREIYEESGITAGNIVALRSMCYVPADVIAYSQRQGWDKDIYVIPEYSFGFECKTDLSLSAEHTECVWLSYTEAMKRLKWDSNKTALYELQRRLSAF